MAAAVVSKPLCLPFCLFGQVWRSSSGHLLVRPKINGRDSGGYMILDTGASGFVITHAAAIALGLGSFGELYAASISGKVRACVHVCLCVRVRVCVFMCVRLQKGMPRKVCAYVVLVLGCI